VTASARPARREGSAGARATPADTVRAGGPPPELNIRPRPRASATESTLGAPDPSPEREAVRVWLRLLSCTNLIEARIRARLRDRFDTTLPRFDLLAQLDGAAREGSAGLTMTRLSRRMMVTNANVTALVVRLESEGLVRRRASPGDRRAQVVSLTPAGRRALAAMTPEHGRWVEAMFAGLSRGEREALHALVGTLKASVERAPLEDIS
jgi:DNA-binding MarR family transcriptional regulator